MTWAEIRRHYAVRLASAKRRGATQETIATAGGLRQNAISKMMTNRRRGPTVDTFARAVEGLGMTLSEFFQEVERSVEHVAASPSSPVTPVEVIRNELIKTRFEILEQRLELLARLDQGRSDILARLERLEATLDRLRDPETPAALQDAEPAARRSAHRRSTRSHRPRR